MIVFIGIFISVSFSTPVKDWDCEKPACRVNETNLFPHFDIEKFWQCIPFGITDWQPIERTCSSPTLTMHYDANAQVCVRPGQANYVCPN